MADTLPEAGWKSLTQTLLNVYNGPLMACDRQMVMKQIPAESTGKTHTDLLLMPLTTAAHSHNDGLSRRRMWGG